MRPRARVATLALLAAAIACGDEPTRATQLPFPTGSYTLVSVDGAALPWVHPDVNSPELTALTDGTLQWEADESADWAAIRTLGWATGGRGQPAPTTREYEQVETYIGLEYIRGGWSFDVLGSGPSSLAPDSVLQRGDTLVVRTRLRGGAGMLFEDAELRFVRAGATDTP